MSAPPLMVAIYLAVLAAPFVWMLAFKWWQGRRTRKWRRQAAERIEEMAKWN